MGSITEEVGEIMFARRYFHPDGSIFFDVLGNKYLLRHADDSVVRLTSTPDPEVLAELSKSITPSDPHRRTAVMCGSGIFRRMSPGFDSRELNDIVYNGELMYNMEADADHSYLILNRVGFTGIGSLPGELVIRGSFKRVAIVESLLVGTKITIISDKNPEIFILGSNLDQSSLKIVDGNGNEYEQGKIIVSKTLPPPDQIDRVLDHVRSGESDIFVAETPGEESVVSDVMTAGAAACLAIAGIVAAAASKKSKNSKKVEENVVKRA